jgi:hypothetical protein
MYTSLYRDEAVVPVIARLMRSVHGYLRTIEDVLMAGRGLRGSAARRTRAAIGHSASFQTGRSLVREHELSHDEAVGLLCGLVDGAA